MKWPTLAALCALLAQPTLAFAQQGAVQQREVKGKPDTDINAGIFATIRKDCTAGPLPAVRLVTPPAHGKVTVKQGKLRATNVKNCLGMELPAFVAIYRSARDFVGQDRFTLEVVGSNGKTQIQQVTVTVMQSGPRPGNLARFSGRSGVWPLNSHPTNAQLPVRSGRPAAGIVIRGDGGATCERRRLRPVLHFSARQRHRRLRPT